MQTSTSTDNKECLKIATKYINVHAFLWRDQLIVHGLLCVLRIAVSPSNLERCTFSLHQQQWVYGSYSQLLNR